MIIWKSKILTSLHVSSEENEDGSEDAHDRLVGAQENTDHTITVPDSVPPEPHICRFETSFLCPPTS